LSGDPFEEILKDPDRRAKLYLLVVVGIILSTFIIVIGTIIFILSVLKII